MLLEDYLGSAAVVFYALVLMPQIVNGIKNQTMQGISFSTLTLWFMGDFTNLLSGYLLDQIFSVKATASLFVSIDLITVVLYLYYEQWKRPNERLYQLKIKIYRLFGILVMPNVVSAACLTNVIDGPTEIYFNQEVIGSLLAWTCAVFYFGSRIPQILLFRKRHGDHSYEPLYNEEPSEIIVDDQVAPIQFNHFVWIFMIIANILYSSSLILMEYQQDFNSKLFVSRTLPFLIGSGGTIPLDLYILFADRYLY